MRVRSVRALVANWAWWLGRRCLLMVSASVPSVVVARREVMRAIPVATVMVPMRAPRATPPQMVVGSPVEWVSSRSAARTGREARMRMFHTVVISMDEVMAVTSNPQDRHMAKLSAVPNAPPAGRMLLMQEPARLLVRAWRWVMPGREALRVKV